MRKRFIGVAIAALTLGLVAVAPAGAVPGPTPDDLNLYAEDACTDTSRSDFQFHIYFNSGEGGSYRNIGYAVYDFDSVPSTDGNHYVLPFCKIGASSPWPGSGQHIKNNAASGDNTHPKYTAHVYSRSGYWGNQDVMWPMQHHDQFVNVYNDNASFQWT
ncbi:hypothetical protein ACFXKR_18090 [Streptomyces violascens]|uniref:hypothetical protein n=1 Tax=Streptomyces violascens TaxID=67381 RepID=UPI00368A13D1